VTFESERSVLDEAIDVMLSSVFAGGHLEDVRHAEQRLTGITVCNHLHKKMGRMIIWQKSAHFISLLYISCGFYVNNHIQILTKRMKMHAHYVREFLGSFTNIQLWVIFTFIFTNTVYRKKPDFQTEMYRV